MSGKTIGEIDEIATSTSSAVEERGAATKEIALNVEEASQETTEVSSNIRIVTEATFETGAAAIEFSEQSETLKTEVDTFMQQVRAA